MVSGAIIIIINYSSRRTESSSEHVASDLSLLKAEAPWCENKRYTDSNPWPIWKRVCYPLHHRAPQINTHSNGISHMQIVWRKRAKFQTAVSPKWLHYFGDGMRFLVVRSNLRIRIYFAQRRVKSPPTSASHCDNCASCYINKIRKR